MSNYLDIIYDSKKIPISNVYPEKLVNYLVDRFSIKENQKLLEPGFGRGDFLSKFTEKKIDCYGFDNSHYSKLDKINLNAKITNVDILKENFPYEDNFFDVIYSKSFIEHFYYPEKLFSEFYRVLKPGGKIISLTPDWKTVYKMFYEDFTHRTPFTLESLRDIHAITGFKNIQSEQFLQLPILWNKNKFLLFFSILTKYLVPNYFIKKFKWVRFSKEPMLLSYAEK